MTKLETSAWLRYLVNTWTLILFIIIIFDFVEHNLYEYLIGPAAAVYVGALVIYSAEKEFERWSDYYEGRHPGEIYVFCWTILIIILILLPLFIKTDYKLPSEVVATYIAVISILAFTNKSKTLFRRKKK